MFHLETIDPWFLRYDFNMPIDFCIWTLETDGLRVSPFDQHHEGDGSLRAAGLDAQGWRAWLTEVVQLQYQVEHAFQQQLRVWHAEVRRHYQQSSQVHQSFTPPHLPPPNISPMQIAEAHNPPAAWTGNAEGGKRLEELWEHYKPISNERKAWRWGNAGGDQATKRLWDDLQPYHTQLETLLIHFVAYPLEVDSLVPPVSVIMTIVNGYLDGETLRTRILSAAEKLATSSTS